MAKKWPKWTLSFIRFYFNVSKLHSFVKFWILQFYTEFFSTSQYCDDNNYFSSSVPAPCLDIFDLLENVPKIIIVNYVKFINNVIYSNKQIEYYCMCEFIKFLFLNFSSHWFPSLATWKKSSIHFRGQKFLTSSFDWKCQANTIYYCLCYCCVNVFFSLHFFMFLFSLIYFKFLWLRLTKRKMKWNEIGI